MAKPHFVPGNTALNHLLFRLDNKNLLALKSTFHDTKLLPLWDMILFLCI